MISVETFKSVVGWDGIYMVSDQGRVLSMSRRVQGPSGRVARRRARFLRAAQRGKGYMSVGLFRDGTRSNAVVHRLVLGAFRGPCPGGMEASHLNGDRLDNRASNLCWETRKDNHARKREHGTRQVGERHGMSKLTTGGVREIRRRLARGESQESVAADFGVHKASIGRIHLGKTWSHV